MYENSEKKVKKISLRRSAKECAYFAVFVAFVIATQLAFSLVPGVELVTVLFVAYAFTFGVTRGVIAATAFSFLRQLVFGVYLNVLVLYLVYFNILAVIFGLLGKGIKRPLPFLGLLVIIACLCTVAFAMLDNVLTPLWYGYSERATKVYFYASFSFMIPQVICAAVSVSVLFLPLRAVFLYAKRRLDQKTGRKI